MNKKIKKKITVVHEHSRHVPVSSKNPSGITIVDRHLRRLPGTYLDPSEIQETFKKYDRESLVFPTPKKLHEFKNADRYDEHIAIWTDYFNKKFNLKPPIDPDVVKALIGSESGFNPDPPGNKTAIGIAQLTRETIKILQDPEGEVKEFVFNKIRLKDLKQPEIEIPLAVRWLARKQVTATQKLSRPPSLEELILEYKGLLKSASEFKEKALNNFRKKYASLKG